jgi:hypothetical protein
MIEAFSEGGGEGKPVFVQAAHLICDNEDEGRKIAHQNWRTNVLGPDLQADLPRILNGTWSGSTRILLQVRTPFSFTMWDPTSNDSSRLLERKYYRISGQRESNESVSGPDAEKT